MTKTRPTPDTTVEEILREFRDRFKWHENESYTFVNPKGKQDVEDFLSSALIRMREDTIEEVIDVLRAIGHAHKTYSVQEVKEMLYKLKSSKIQKEKI